MRIWASHPFACFLVLSAVWVALLYAKALNEPFVYDDVVAVQHNAALSSWHDALRYFRTPVELNNAYRGFAGSIYRPLSWLGLLIDHQISGNDPAVFHATNVLLHWANGAIGFLLLWGLGVPAITAAATCLIWLTLPINSEAVVWISGRHTCQAAFFILLSLLAAVGYMQRKRRGLLLGYVAAVFCALLSNEWGMLALPLTAFVIYIRRPTDKGVWLSLGPGGIAITLVELAMRRLAGAHLPGGSLAVLPVGLSFFKYVAWMLLPVNMSVERSTDTPANNVSAGSATALVALCCLVLLVIFLLRKWAPEVAAGLSWTIICLLPFCGFIFIYQGMAERYTYLASAGLVFAVVALVSRAKGRLRSVTFAALVLWVAFSTLRLEARILDWRDQTALFRSSLAADPRSPILLYNLGLAAADRGDRDEAIRYYQRALESRPDYVDALVNLSNLLRQQGNYAAALALEQRAIAVSPQSADVWINLGDTYWKEGFLEKAAEAFRKAISIDRSSLEATTNLGAVLLKKGDSNGAIKQFQHAIQQDAAYYPAYFDLGLVYESTGRNELAAPMFEKVLQLRPGDADALRHLRTLQEP